VERVECKMKFGKLYCIIMFPVFPVGFLIDIFFGDYVTGTKTTIIEKFKQHKKFFMITWNEI